MTQTAIETRAVEAAKKALAQYGYKKSDGTYGWTARAGKALNFEEIRFDKALRSQGYSGDMIYTLWNDCKDMAELEAMNNG
jgi:hypothetical protein